MQGSPLVRVAVVILAVIMILAGAAGAAQAFYQEIKLCANDKNQWVTGLDPKKPTNTAASCVDGEKVVNWQVDVIATQGGGLHGDGFECSTQSPWSYKNTFHYATELQYMGQVGCVLIRITQD